MYNIIVLDRENGLWVGRVYRNDLAIKYRMATWNANKNIVLDTCKDYFKQHKIEDCSVVDPERILNQEDQMSEEWKPGFVSFNASSLYNIANIGVKKSSDPMTEDEVMKKGWFSVPPQPKRITASVCGCKGQYSTFAVDDRDVQVFFGKQHPTIQDACCEFWDWANGNPVSVVDFRYDVIPDLPKVERVVEKKPFHDVLLEQIVRMLKNFSVVLEKDVAENHHSIMDEIRLIYRLLKVYERYYSE